MRTGETNATTAAHSLRLCLLGRPRLWRDGVELTGRIQYRKGIALLGYLAVHAGQWQARSRLAQLLWPDLEPAAARTNLRQVLNRLTSLLDGTPPVLEKNVDAIRLIPAGRLTLDLDMLAGERPAPPPGSSAEADWCAWLEPEATALFGEFLDGLELSDTAAFDDWLQLTRQHFLGRASTLVERLCRARHRQGRLAAAIAAARLLQQAMPLDEGHALLLMSLLVEDGDGVAALAVLDGLRHRLALELSATPGAPLESLAADIRRGSLPATRAAAPALPELRWATALYCTPGAQADDAWQDSSAFMVEVQAQIRRRGGMVVSLGGRGLLAAFGFGSGIERAAERAALAARDIHRGPAARFAPRTGLCAGQILFQPAEPAPRLLGETPDRAMLIGWSAAEGEILADEAVALQAAAHFHFEAAGERSFPGVTGTHPLFRLGHALQPDGRGTAQAPLAGRRQELAALQALWQAACGGQTRIALLRAPAGYGKTRLAGELARRVQAAGGQIRRIDCRLERQHQPLAPITASLARFAADAGERRPGARQASIRHALLDAHPTLDSSSVEQLAALLTREDDGDTLPSKGATFAALLQLIDSLTARTPALLIVDDLHWSDQATLELLDFLVRSLARQKLLLVVTSRPGVHFDENAGAIVPIDLAPLTTDDALTLVADNDPANRIPGAERAQIAAACGGIPLFIERLALCWLEGRHHRHSITELLQSELDGLGPAKPVLLTAAVLGASFTFDALQRLLPDVAMTEALNEAIARRLVAPTDAGHYRFSHALIRDTAYDSLPPTRRRQLHRQAAALLADQAEPPAEAVAAHFAAAECWREAAGWWLQAGEAAMAREFAADALHCFEQALDTLQRQDTPAAGLVDVQMRLGHAAQVAQGFGSARAHRLFSAVAQQLEAGREPPTPDHSRKLFSALSGRYMGGSSQGEVEGLKIAHQLERLAHTDGERLMASFALGNSLFWRGQLEEARTAQLRGIALAARLLPRDRIRYCVDDPAVTCRAFLGWNLWFLGEEAAACAMVEEAVAHARHGGRVHTLCFALAFGAAMHWCRGAVEDVVRLSGEARTLAQSHGLPLWDSVNSLFLLWAQAATGELHDARPLFEAAGQMQQAYRAGITTSRWIAVHALLTQQARATAEPLLDLALREADANEDQYCLADLMWQKGECRLADGALQETRQWWQQALALAGGQRAGGLLARFEARLRSTGVMLDAGMVHAG